MSVRIIYKICTFPCNEPENIKNKNGLLKEKKGYSHLMWMLYSSRINNHINNIHKGAPRLTFKGNQFSYNKLLGKDGFVTDD